MPARVIPGKTDLATTHPEIAKEAEGWDPTTVSFGSGKLKLWKCSLGHIYEKAPNRRTTPGFASGCPYCGGSKILAGFNDLATFHEAIANQAHGWDPTTVSRASDQKKSWQCELGHIWEATVKNRTLRDSGCPVCDGKKVMAWFNDLATKFPDIAKEADGWDPSLVTPFSGKKRAWKCPLGHTYEKQVAARCLQPIGCPYCSGKEVLKGFNDLETKFPEIAKAALGWDPSLIQPFSNTKAS